MDSRIQLFLVAALMGSISAPNAMAAQPKDLELEPLVVREPERREVKVDEIDSENFEIGAYGGILDIQDFGSNAVYGVRAAYHVTEDFFVEGLYGRSELGETSFEKLSGNVELLTDDDRQFSYYNLSVGYNILPGEAFVGRKYAFRGGLYLIAGAGSSDFAGDQRFTVSGGLRLSDGRDGLAVVADRRARLRVRVGSARQQRNAAQPRVHRRPDGLFLRRSQCTATS